jgi:hypothetical protein
MYFYNVLPTKNMGQNLSILLYSSQNQASVGDIVEITIRNNIDFGLILSENVEEMNKHKVEAASARPIKSEEIANPPDRIFRDAQDDETLNHNFDNKNTKSEVKTKKFEIKEINKILPIKLSQEQIQFLKIFSDNTFNSLNDTWDAIVQPYCLLTQKQWKELDQIADTRFNSNTKQLVDNIDNTNTSSKEIQKAQNGTFIEAKKLDKTTEDSKNIIETPEEVQITPKVEFLIDFDIIVRIMYIIRSLASIIKEDQKALKQGINRQLLIVFPEKKYLNKVYKSIYNEISGSKELSEIVEVLYYAGEPTKKPKECVWSMLNFEKINSKINLAETKNQNIGIETNVTITEIIENGSSRYAQDDTSILNSKNSFNNKSSNNINQTSQNVNTENETPRLQIILSTRSGLFLPFTTLTDIILVDEGNSMYIQDQNSLYYDTREAIFLISKAFNANISFISPLPSIRLYNMYNKEALEKQIINYANIIQKPRKIKISRFDRKSSKYDLFGYEIEQILEGIE